MHRRAEEPGDPQISPTNMATGAISLAYLARLVRHTASVHDPVRRMEALPYAQPGARSRGEFAEERERTMDGFPWSLGVPGCLQCLVHGWKRNQEGIMNEDRVRVRLVGEKEHDDWNPSSHQPATSIAQHAAIAAAVVGASSSVVVQFCCGAIRRRW